MANALVAALAAQSTQRKWMAHALIGPTLLWIAIGGTCLLWSVSLLLLTRRIGGGLIEPLRPSTALALSLGLCAVVIFIRAAAMTAKLTRPQSLTRGRFTTLLLAPGIACFFIVVAITLPGTTGAAALGLYFPLVLFEIGTLAMVAWAVTHGLRSARPVWLSNITRSPRIHSQRDRALAQPAALTNDECLPAGVTQQLVRSRTAEGCDTIHGTLRVRFAAHQRTEVLHVAFCPPFEVNPRWNAKAVSGPALTIKPAQVFPYGARIEVRLNESPLAPVESLVSFTAIEPA